MKQNKLTLYFEKFRLFGSGILLAQEAAPKGIKSGVFDDIGELFVGDLDSPIKAGTLADLIIIIVNILLMVAASIAVIFLIIGGYRYIVAHGKEEETESAKKTITSAIWGLVIITLSFVIVTIIANILTRGGPGTGLITG